MSGGEGGRRAALRRAWQRVRLVPFLLLLLCVIAAVIAGIVTRERLRDGMTDLPVSTQGARLPEACGPAPAAISPQQPWSDERRSASEAAWREAMARERDPAIEGRDGWVFWGDEQAQNLSQAVGRRALVRHELEAWASYLTRLHDELDARGIDFVVQIVPAKWSVYPQQLPEWAQGMRGATSLDLLRAAYPALPVMDMRASLREASAQKPVYSPLNSHWTSYGAATGWEQLSACLTAIDAARYGGLGPVPVRGYAPAPHGSEFAEWGHPGGARDGVRPEWAEPPGPMTVRSASGAQLETTSDHAVDLLELPAWTETQRPQSSARALIFRDSQGMAIAPWWQAGFARTAQYPHELDHPERAQNPVALAEREQPDLVIYEFTERHLHYLPVLNF